MSGWSAGVASITFPVAPGTEMAGYMARTGPSTGTHDPLTISALVLSWESDTLAIVSVDLAAVDVELADEIAGGAGLARSALILCASHTHSGPAGVVKRMHPADVDRLDPELRAAFTARCVGAISSARARMEPVELLFGQSTTNGLAANRNNPDGPFDNRASIIAAKNAGGGIISVLVHFPCHPTILSHENRLISADFPGALRRAYATQDAVEVVHFANGTAGDVSTRFTRQSQDFTEVERIGSELAEAARAAVAAAVPMSGGIRYERALMTLEARPLDESMPNAGLTTGSSVALSAFERRKAETRAQGEIMLARLATSDPAAIRTDFELEGWRIGGINLVAAPGELFASLGCRITAGSRSPTLVLGYCNGYVGYLADEAAFDAGTYEALASPFAAGAGERFAEHALHLVRKLDDRD